MIVSSFARGLRPPQNLGIVEWAARNVRLARSSRSSFCDLRQTPWLIEPLEAVLFGDASEIVLKAPVGSGKTTLLETLACYIVAEKPGPALFAAQTDADAKDWHDTGLLPALQACEPIKPLWPADRHKVGKGAIFFPHMPLWCCGANLSNLQSKSCDYVVLDEAWMLKRSLLQEARRRTHDRFNSKVLLVSQGGTAGEDFEEAYDSCQISEFCFRCPSCGSYHPWRWGNLRWESTERWEDLAPRYQCECGHTWHDTPADRRAMADSARYVAQSSVNPVPGHVAFTYNALAVWWIEWRKLVIEWLTAQEAKKRGDLAPLRQFLQKRLSQAWTEEEQLEIVPIARGSYSLGEGELLDVTILTVDVQKDEFWFTVRTWSRAGESRLLDFGKLLTFKDIEKKQKQWKISNKAVFVDFAYRGQEVKSALAKYGWIGLNGRGEDSFPIKKRGKNLRRIYSIPTRHTVANGMALTVNYSSCGAKDILHVLKQGNGALWETPIDLPQVYVDSLNSEVKKQTAKKIEWVQVKSHNHYLDTEAMQVIAAMMHYCYPEVLTGSAD